MNYEIKQGAVTTKDLSPIREFHIDDSNQIIYVKREDPYGFWFISFKMGTVPEDMKQAFTTFAKAKEVVDNYLKERYEREAKRKARPKKTKLTPPMIEENAVA
jgi:hypothetical protein